MPKGYVWRLRVVVIQGLRGLGLEDPCKNKGRLKIHMSKKKMKGMKGGMKKEGREEEKRGGKKLHLCTTSLHVDCLA